MMSRSVGNDALAEIIPNGLETESCHQEKKNLPMIFHLGTCAIGMCLVLLAGHWQVGQQIGCQLLNTLLISWQCIMELSGAGEWVEQLLYSEDQGITLAGAIYTTLH